MARTPDQVAQAIIDKLSVTDPALSLEIGTPERKIVDAVSEAISESTIDNYLLGYSLDIDTKAGVDLENFVQLFGFARQAGRYATGQVQFTLAYPATTDVQINAGTQLYVPASITGSTDLYFSTVTATAIAIGTQTVSVPVQCAVMGTSGNVASTTITGYEGGFGVAAVTNSSPCTGGIDPESDDALRQRFRRTFLRNITGTRGFYAALMLQNLYTTQCAVIGPYQNYLEEVQFNGTTKVYSTNTNAKYIWPVGWWLYRDQGLPTEIFYISGVDYQVDATVNPPGITPIHPDLTATGATANFEYQYTPIASRNAPATGISNKIDLFINGTQTIDVTETVIATPNVFSATTTDTFYTGNFLRADNTAVVAPHRFQLLGSVPVVSYPGIIYSPTNTYTLNTDYVAVQSTTLDRGSVRELSGVEWITATPPAAGTMLTVGYTYNRVPELMQSIMTAQRQLTTDVLVHQANYKAIYVSVVIAYSFGQNVAGINATISNVLINFFTNTGFGAWVQFSDLVQVIHNVPGVDNVRIARSTDVVAGTPYGVVTRLNTVVQNVYTSDFRLNDNELPVFDGIQLIRRAPNTFGN